MFVRYRKLEEGKIRVQIVENYRVKDKISQKVIRHVGTAKNEEELAHIKNIAEYMKATIEEELRPPKLFSKEQLPEKVVKSRKEQVEAEIPTLVNIRNIRAGDQIIKGIHEVYGRLFDSVGYGNILRKRKISNMIFKDIVMARLSEPVSKSSSVDLLSKKFGIEHDLSQVYRMMDAIKSEKKNGKKEVVQIDKIPEIQKHTLSYSQSLLDGNITIFFYDCTTLYFESFIEDDLRRFGYSKDHKFNQGQVLLALMVSDEGLPIGYELFPGNVFEGDTFQSAIDKLKDRYSIKTGIIVADSGLLSKENMEIVKASGFQYILGARLKNMSKKWQAKILSNTEYDDTRTIYFKDKTGNKTKNGEVKDILQIKDYDYKEEKKKKKVEVKEENKEEKQDEKKDVKTNERLIVSRSSVRAKKDKNDREKAIEKFQLKLKKSKNPTTLISNYGYKKFMKLDGTSTVSINEAKVAQAALWDGLHGAFTNTNRKEIDAYAVLKAYHGLWQVEDSFRIDKHDIRMRPIFHWTPDRIKAHIAICFVAFSLIRFLQHHIKQEINERFSARRISAELNSVQETILYDVNNNKKRYVLPSKISDDAQNIYKAMKLHRGVVPYKLRE
jgi:transposase